MEAYFRPSSSAEAFGLWQLHGYYADGLPVPKVFQKIVSLFQVVEFFFLKLNGKKLDSAVADYTKPFAGADDFSVAEVAKLRTVGVAIAHTHPVDGKLLNRHSPAGSAQAGVRFCKIRRLAQLILKHPLARS